MVLGGGSSPLPLRCDNCAAAKAQLSQRRGRNTRENRLEILHPLASYFLCVNRVPILPSRRAGYANSRFRPVSLLLAAEGNVQDA